MSFTNLKINDTAFQIRTTSRKFARWMNAALAPYRVRRKAPVAYSVVLAGGEEDRIGARKKFHIIYQGNQRVVRTKDIGTLARGLFAELERAQVVDRDDAIYLNMPAVLMDGKVAVVPEFYRTTLERLGRRPALAGLRLPVERVVGVDPDTGSVVPITPRLQIPEDAVDRVIKMFGGNGEAPVARIDRPMRPNVVVGYRPKADPEDHMQPISRGRALYCAATQALNGPKLGVERVLEGLARFVEDADLYGFYNDASTPQHRNQMLTGITEVLSR